MAVDVFHQLYYHFVWATRDRLPLPEQTMRDWLMREIRHQAEKRSSIVLAVYVMPDHVHLLVNLSPGDLTTFIGQVKGATSFAFNKEFGEHHPLKWQDGYGVLTLRKSNTPQVIEYIEQQEQVHSERRLSRLMECYGIDDSEVNGVL